MKQCCSESTVTRCASCPHPGRRLLPPPSQSYSAPPPLQLAHLTRRFTDVMRHHHAAQMSFREKIKAQIQRQLKIGKGVEPFSDWLFATDKLTGVLVFYLYT